MKTNVFLRWEECGCHEMHLIASLKYRCHHIHIRHLCCFHFANWKLQTWGGFFWFHSPWSSRSNIAHSDNLWDGLANAVCRCLRSEFCYTLFKLEKGWWWQLLVKITHWECWEDEDWYFIEFLVFRDKDDYRRNSHLKITQFAELRYE